jgi:AraC-like DNA-binding protein
MLVVSTDTVPAAHRLDCFREGVRQAYFEFDVRSLASGSFHGRVRTYEVARLLSGRIEGSAMEVRRPGRLVHTSRFDGCFLNLQIRGRSLVEQAGRTAQLAPGDGFFIEAHRLPFRFYNDVAFEQLSLHLPAACLPARLREPGSLGARKITADSGIARMLLGAIQAATAPDLPPQLDEASTIEEHLLAMLHTLWAGSAPPAQPQGMERLLPWLERHLDEPWLNVDAAAAELRCSRRTVQQLFHQRGQTFSQYVRRRRIERAQALLLQPASRGTSILDIALAVGFSDLSTFCRTFRRLTGQSASEYRNRLHG